MVSKWYLFMLLGLALLLTSLVVGCDKPYYSEDELTAIVKDRLLRYYVRGTPPEQQATSASVSNVNYVGDRKWSGTCRIYFERTRWYGTWIYYEQSGTLDTDLSDTYSGDLGRRLLGK